MRKTVTLGVISIIVLSTFVVLGNSPNMLGDIFESVQSNSLVKLFADSSLPAPVKPAETTAKPIRNRVSTVSESFAQMGSDIPDDVLYDTVFRLDVSFRSKASEQRDEGKPPTAFEYYFKDEASLTSEDDLALQQVASEFVQEINSIDAQATKIIDGGAVNPDTIADLSRLQEERNAIALSNRDKLQTLMGETAFRQFDEYVHGGFAAHLSSTQAPTN